MCRSVVVFRLSLRFFCVTHVEPCKDRCKWVVEKPWRSFLLANKYLIKIPSISVAIGKHLQDHSLYNYFICHILSKSITWLRGSGILNSDWSIMQADVIVINKLYNWLFCQDTIFISCATIVFVCMCIHAQSACHYCKINPLGGCQPVFLTNVEQL